MLLPLLQAYAAASDLSCPEGRVVDRSGAAVVGATVTLTRPQAPPEHVRTGADGRFTFPCGAAVAAGGSLSAVAPGLAATPLPFRVGDDVVLLVTPVATEEVSVATTRSSAAVAVSTTSVQVLDRQRIARYPALTLDERLRQVAGFELFRRTSSWAANPTSEGLSLRGLGSTAASRSLVLLDGAPLNDGFGGWVHWNELPQDALSLVTIATGGGSDLYGSSALGGVVDIIPARPTTTQVEGGLSGASEDTSDAHLRFALAHGPWGESVSGEDFRTAGYIPLAPALLGPVDRPANVHSQAGRINLEHRGSNEASGDRLFLNGNLLNEARGNGTELQTNGTRIWRWLAGDRWSAGSHASGNGRLFGSEEHYRQTFSSVNANRTVETLTRVQKPVTQEFGASLDAAAQWRGVALVAGTDLRDLRADDVETPQTGAQARQIQTTSARQRFIGGFAEAFGTVHGWSAAASVRVDSAENLAARASAFRADGTLLSAAPIANRAEILASPRLGLAREWHHDWQLHASAFRAFRAPTMNELYRTGQVGQETTLANAGLLSERATGADGGVAWTRPAARLHVAATYFWTEINRPVSAVLLSSTATTITNMRENLGQIQSQGVELRTGWNDGGRVSANVSYQYAHATVTAFAVQPGLVGLRIPNVPRQSVTMQLRAAQPRWGTVTVAARASGKAFDDSSNVYPLARFFVLDAFADHRLGRGWTAFISAQNMLNQRVQTARTPLLTLGNPAIVQGGVRFSWTASPR